MFGNYDENKSEENEEKFEEVAQTITNNTNFHKEKNPFKYDSSDDDDETEDIPHKNEITENKEVTVEHNNTKNNVRQPKLWTDPFFFKFDDYRLQEGFDFVERMKFEEKTEFTKLRRDLKEIVKAKVRNNARKNKPFKKKLGGSRKKKVLRIKKAMKR